MTGSEIRIGRVVSVTGSQVVVLLEKPQETSGPSGVVSLQMGQLIKMLTPSSTVFGMVTGMSIPLPSPNEGDSEMKIVELEMLGESSLKRGSPFKRGVSAYPGLGDPVYQTTLEDLRQVYARPAVSTVRIGTIHQDHSIPAYVAIDDLLGKHFAVLGTTGSGKSCAVTLVLQSILSKHENGHIVLLDPHNEYSQAFGESAQVLSPGNLRLPYWLLNFEEILEVLLEGGPETSATQHAAEISVLSELIPAAKRKYMGQDEESKFVTVDTPVPYQIGDLVGLIDEAMGRLDNPENSVPYMRIKSRLNSLRMDSRFAFMFGGLTVRDNMTEILSRIFRIPVAGKPITIMDLSGVPSEILNVVVSVLCRMTFDFALWSDRAVPVTLICEEAHRYAPRDTRLGFEPTKKALARIAKEGRKYGVSLGMVTQRPSELAPGILSQCNTIFALRMSNQNDQDFVRSTLSESAVGLLDFLPSLRNGEAIGVGEGVSIPMRLAFDRIPDERRPMSGTASFSSAWKAEADSPEFLDEVVKRWRYQRK